MIMPKLKILIKGETINLCLPTLKFARGDVWYKWLNKPIIIKNLKNHYRKLNNTKKKQKKFFLKNKKKKKKLKKIKKLCLLVLVLAYQQLQLLLIGFNYAKT